MAAFLDKKDYTDDVALLLHRVFKAVRGGSELIINISSPSLHLRFYEGIDCVIVHLSWLGIALAELVTGEHPWKSFQNPQQLSSALQSKVCRALF